MGAVRFRDAGGIATASAETNEGFILALAFANLSIGLGALLCSLGYLVRAIWFLPGRTIETQPIDTIVEAETNECSYCGIAITSPAQPCSAVPPASLSYMIDRIDDENCLVVLRKEGILPEAEGN